MGDGIQQTALLRMRVRYSNRRKQKASATRKGKTMLLITEKKRREQGKPQPTLRETGKKYCSTKSLTGFDQKKKELKGSRDVSEREKRARRKKRAALEKTGGS